MDESTVRSLAQVYALAAEMEAIKADMAGMVAENQHRVQCGDRITYGQIVFFNLRDQLDEITAMLKSEATGR
jgi:biotin carboxyl carrier protein